MRARRVRPVRHRRTAPSLSRAPAAEKALRDADNRLMEFLVIELLRRAGEIGITQVSLNFAMFRSVFERGGRLGAGPVPRL